jgi:hypothetical protein
VVDVSLNFDGLKLNWVIDIVIWYIPENHNFMISSINTGHLGADLSILRCKKCFRRSFTPKKNLGGQIWTILYDVEVVGSIERTASILYNVNVVRSIERPASILYNVNVVRSIASISNPGQINSMITTSW